MYLVTHNVSFRAYQDACGKAHLAGNVDHIAKRCNAAVGVLIGSLWASRQMPSAVLRFLEIVTLCLRNHALLLTFGGSLNVTI